MDARAMGRAMQEGPGRLIHGFRASANSSASEIGSSTLQSRAFAGLANGTLVFRLPGSTGACRSAWEMILPAQLDARHRSCDFAPLLPRFAE
jgi:molybdenum cofactor biosynthesis protein B